MSSRVRDEEGNVIGTVANEELRTRLGLPKKARIDSVVIDHCDPPLRPMTDRDKADAIAFAMRGIGKTTNQHGEEKVMGIPTSRIMSDSRLNSYGGALNKRELYGGARNEGMTVGVDVTGFDVEKFKAKGSVERMAVLRQRPTVQLETDSCGRYHFSKAIMYREVETKRNGTYREQIVGYGVARRQHGDPKDEYVGEGLAVSRALEDLGFKIGRRSWGKVKHNDDIKVMRRVQKKRRQAQAEAQKETFTEKLERTLREVVAPVIP